MYIRSLPYKPSIPPSKIYPNANPFAIELLQQMLTFNPAKRISVEEVVRVCVDFLHRRGVAHVLMSTYALADVLASFTCSPQSLPRLSTSPRGRAPRRF